MTEEELITTTIELLTEFENRNYDWSFRELKHLQIQLYATQLHIDSELKNLKPKGEI